MTQETRQKTTHKTGSLLHRFVRFGKLGIFVLKNVNFHTLERAVTYVRRHGYRALRGKMLYKFSRKEQSAHMPILKTEISWHMAQDLHRLDAPVSGFFRFPVNGLKMIEVQTVTSGHIPGPLQLVLKDAEGIALQKSIVPGIQVLDGDYTRFPLEPVADSEGKMFHFEIKALEKPYPSVFYHHYASLRDVTLDMPGSINCRIFADAWKGDEYELWMRKCEPVATELEEQRETRFNYEPLISILVPMYKTPLPLFQEMLQSVQAQTYAKWELCLAVANNSMEESDVLLWQAVHAEAEKDARVHCVQVTENQNIVNNSNAAAKLANGDYLGLLDHDDTLAPFALFAVVSELNGMNASDATVTVHAGGSAVLVHDAGSTALVHAGGSTALVHDAGSTALVHAGGSAILVHDAGSTVLVHAGGSTVLVHDAGSNISVHAEGTIDEIDVAVDVSSGASVSSEPATDIDFLYSDEDKIDENGKIRSSPHFKPDFAPDTLRSYNYICHFSIIKTSLFLAVGGFRPGYEGSQDYDLFLRVTEKAKHIVHIPQILYHWRETAYSTARNIGVKPYVVEAARNALLSHLERLGMPGAVEDGVAPTTYGVRYSISGEPLVSVIIPNKDHVNDLKTCLNSVLSKTTWTNYEILIVENNSTAAATFQYYETLKDETRVRVINYTGGFNYSAINNLGAREAKGDFLLLLNNDTEVLSPDWMTRMLEHAQRRDVGAVGAKLYYPDNTIQHAGVILGLNTLADHAFKNVQKEVIGYFGRTHLIQNASIVTAACMMIRKDVYFEMGGLDETFAVAFNDVDLCMKLRQKGYLIVFTPYAELSHYESKTRGLEDTPKKKKRFHAEVLRFYERWGFPNVLRDPYYNPNLSYEGSGYDLSVW